jgi:hypothetical protein
MTAKPRKLTKAELKAKDAEIRAQHAARTGEPVTAETITTGDTIAEARAAVLAAHGGEYGPMTQRGSALFAAPMRDPADDPFPADGRAER